MFFLSDFCCICLGNNNLVHLSSSDSTGVSYHAKLACLRGMLYNKVNKRILICEGCVRDVDFVYQFQRKCVRSEVRLKNYLTQLTVLGKREGFLSVSLIDFVDSKRKMTNSNFKTVRNSTVPKHLTTDISEAKADNMEYLPDFCHVIVKSETPDFEPENSEFRSGRDIFKDQNFLNSDPSLKLQGLELRVNNIKKENLDLDLESSSKNADYGASFDPLMNLGEPQSNIETVGEIHALGGIRAISSGRQAPEFVDCNKNANKTSKNVYEYNCVPCGINFESKDELSSHVCMLHTCAVCSKQVSGKIAFTQHMSLHCDENPYKCDLCGNKYNSKSSLNVHLKLHTGLKQHKCIICQKMFSQAGNLKRHILLHTLAHNCETCGLKFRSRHLLEKHMQKHVIKNYDCEVCDKKFCHSKQLETHMLVHTANSTYKCTLCDKAFYDTDSLNQHTSTHANDKPLPCSYCQKKCISADELNRHMLKHTGNKAHKCDICHSKFTYRNALNRHKLTHTGDKPHECTICQKKFSLAGNLKQHMLLHDGIRPHECTVCHRKFSESGNLKRHMLLHTGERPHSCELCEKKFRKRSNLLSHMLVHTGDRPYNCDVCGEKFPFRYRLQRHRKIHASPAATAV